MTRIRTTGAPVLMRRREDGTVKLSTFIPLKIRKRGVSKVIVRPEVDAGGENTVFGGLCQGVTRSSAGRNPA